MKNRLQAVFHWNVQNKCRAAESRTRSTSTPWTRTTVILQPARAYLTLCRVLMQSVQIFTLRQPADAVLSGTLAHWRLGYLFEREVGL